MLVCGDLHVQLKSCHPEPNQLINFMLRLSRGTNSTVTRSRPLSVPPQVFVNEVNTHREQVLALEKAGSQLRFASIKQDVVLIKNLLLSVQARWDKLVQRSLDRGRHLDEARKRAKQVLTPGWSFLRHSP